MEHTSSIKLSHIRLHEFQSWKALNSEFLTEASVLLVIAINSSEGKYSSHMLGGLGIRRRQVFTMTTPPG